MIRQNTVETNTTDVIKDVENISKKFEISEATADDAMGIQTVIRESSKGMYELCGWSAEDIDKHFNSKTVEQGAEIIAKYIKTFTDANILLVAKDSDGKVVGCCFAEKQDNMNKLELMYVIPDFQGVGLSKKLFSEVYELLNKENDTILDVFSLNSKGISFYKKLGFIETGKKSFDEKYTGSGGEMLEITEMRLPGRKNMVSPTVG
jgi:N-acetylglutamate synthase-like GNAT family acetyltransferase